MELNTYALEVAARERLDAARALAARRRRVREGAARPALRVRVGAALIGVGIWLQGCAPGTDPIPRKRLSPAERHG